MTTKVFLSHAGEDKPIVEHIYGRLVERYPDVEPWLDKFEILGGESLIDRIAEGINSADKFVVFLSPISVLKPWVNRELKKAITQEIKSGNDTFIIPVLLGKLAKIPDFLEDKLYLEMARSSEEEFLAQLYAAIKGLRNQGAPKRVQNVGVHVLRSGNRLQVQLEAQYWAEDVAFEIELSHPYATADFSFRKTGTALNNAVAEEKMGNLFRIAIVDKRLVPGDFMAITFVFDRPVPDVQVRDVRPWPEGFSKEKWFLIQG